jgi:MFS family permease
MVLFLVYVGSVLPTPLYVIYRQQFHFSEITLTLIYTVYVGGTLAALSFFGRLSDQIGRRRTILAVLGIVAISTLIFVFPVNRGMLFVGRLLSGFGTGIVAGTATAWLVELHPKRIHANAIVIAVVFNLAGLALGPLMSGVVAQYAALPLRLAFVIYLPMLALAWWLTTMAQETIEQPVAIKEASLRPRIGVPKDIRKEFLAPAATAFATFALFGFYSALTPSLLRQDLQQNNHAIAGAVVCELSAVAALAIVLTRAWQSRTVMLAGMSLLLPAIALLELAREFRSMWILLVATSVGGISIALAYRGSLELVNKIAPGEQRAEVISAYFVACYAGLSLPVIGVGVLSQLVTAAIANLTFGALVAAFAAMAVITGRRFTPKTA